MIEDTKHIKIDEYNYELPDERIAKYPVEGRDASKLLVYRAKNVSHDKFTSIPDYLEKGELMVFNNTKVVRARMHFHKETGALIEVFCLEPAVPADYAVNFASRGRCSWYCMIGNLKKWKQGALSRVVCVDGREITLNAERGEIHGTSHLVTFTWDAPDLSFAEVLDAAGELPIPPYLNRDTEESDLNTYQTVYSKIEGSVAAPTAGLHFTERVLESIDAKGVEREEITLHVGAGTFKPVKSETIEGHEMHTEYISVRRSTIDKILNHDCRVTAVGTTSVRTLESLYYLGEIASRNMDASQDDMHVMQWTPYEGSHPLTVRESLLKLAEYMDVHELSVLHASTQIIIAPGYTYKIVKKIVTNFHQPKSTLLLLVSAFVKGDWKKIYHYALDNDFRFLSYGDSSILFGE